MIPPPTEYSWERVYTPFSMSEALAVVPPMSKLTTSLCPVSLATEYAPTTPPAGPDSTMLTGFRAASAAGVRPPLDCISSTGASIPIASKFSSRLARYRDTIGRM